MSDPDPEFPRRTAGLLVEVYAVGTPGTVGVSVHDDGPEPLSPTEVRKVLRGALEFVDERDGGGADLTAALAAVDNALRNGSHMTRANLAFGLLCEQLGVDRDTLVFDPQRPVQPS